MTEEVLVWLQPPAPVRERHTITHAAVILEPDGSIKIGVPRNRVHGLLAAGFEPVDIVDAAS